jgi:hypothetical protein
MLAVPVENLPEGQAEQMPFDEKVPGPQGKQLDSELWLDESFPDVPVPAGQAEHVKLPEAEE